MLPTDRNATNPKQGSKINIWQIVSIILAIALVAVIGVSLSGKYMKKGADKDMKILKSDEAATSLIGFINEVYGERVGTVTFKSVADKNGLYEVTFSMTGTDNTPTDQVVYVTKDGKIFIPQVIDVAQMKDEFQKYKAQQAAGGAAPAANTNTAPTNTNTDSAPTPAQE